MAHPDVLVEEDHVANLRWLTVNGRHLPLLGATEPLEEEIGNIPPSDPCWEDFMDAPDAYARFKQRLTSADPHRAGLSPESITPSSWSYIMGVVND